MNLKKFGLAALSASALFLTACGQEDGAADVESVVDGEEIELAYVDWDSEIASTHVIGEVLESLGYDVTLTSLDNAVMWQSVANGDADAMVSAWLPHTHGDQEAEYGDQMDHVGTNLEGAKIGLGVPTYMEVDSIADLTDEAEQTITGIEAGAGVVQSAEQALEDYDNLSDWTVATSSSGAMVTELETAINNEEDIVVTAWSPHWKFQTFDLKYLDDPEESFGGDETIETYAREGLEEDMPEAYSVLENFYWELDEMEEVMLDISEGAEPEDAAAQWVEENQDRVSEWTANVSSESQDQDDQAEDDQADDQADDGAEDDAA
ncbi:Glycine betaine-binding protein precursor [Alloiococcus otitis]|uniref:ABC-type glycine betaine transport system substrate-binding domain-containing protein n=1 Tax=Alloiococcus otitis ATCC 51267 TaxID=883081 RepID=K9ESL7_9LACT|nr:glycine betaine ABC transporter substrate-binding protein [Alloiococcus otitis]EKU93927.1 hypothetical protein HMPREF9698_00523 [Alloiococcus otitis ATCC 51267]SUU81647.1 Glycine betaine-binding protein precursor [Alloiococcus otitis]